MNWSALNPFWEWLSTAWASVLPAPVVDFPISPSNGEQFGRFVWNETKGTWDIG